MEPNSLLAQLHDALVLLVEEAVDNTSSGSGGSGSSISNSDGGSSSSSSGRHGERSQRAITEPTVSRLFHLRSLIQRSIGFDKA